MCLWIGNVSEALILVYAIFILQALFNNSSSLEAVDAEINWYLWAIAMFSPQFPYIGM